MSCSTLKHNYGSFRPSTLQAVKVLSAVKLMIRRKRKSNCHLLNIVMGRRSLCRQRQRHCTIVIVIRSKFRIAPCTLSIVMYGFQEEPPYEISHKYAHIGLHCRPPPLL